ncbi:MAG: PCRF domain-containing protein [Hymenobacter sp.]
MLDKLEAIRERHDTVNHELMQPEVMSDTEALQEPSIKRYKELGRIVTEYRAYQHVLSNIDGARQVSPRKRTRTSARWPRPSWTSCCPKQERMEVAIKELLIPKDPNDSKDVIMEIRAGAGGDEAAHFRRRPAAHVPALRRKAGLENGIGGRDGRHQPAATRKSYSAVKGEDVYGKLKFEIGRAPRAARAGHRNPGPYPHFGSIHCGDARGGGV